jgi:hypothetical protein
MEKKFFCDKAIEKMVTVWVSLQCISVYGPPQKNSGKRQPGHPEDREQLNCPDELPVPDLCGLRHHSVSILLVSLLEFSQDFHNDD